MSDNTTFAWHVIEHCPNDAHLRKDRTLAPLDRKLPSTITVRGDLFHPNVPDGWIDFVFNMTFLCPRHRFIICTAHPGRMQHYLQIVLRETNEQTAYRFGVAMMHAGLENTPKDKLPKIVWPPHNVFVGGNRFEVRLAGEFMEPPE